MKRGMPVGRSRAASWARLTGALGVPVLAIGALANRFGIVPEGSLIPILVVGFGLALLALGVGAYALSDIWNSGAEGAGAAIAGMVYALPVLVLLGVVASAALVYPRMTDVTTDIDDPPALDQPRGPGAQRPDPDRFALQAEAYPDMAPRLYSLPISDVFSSARALVEERGWTITRESPPPSLPSPEPADTAASAVAGDPQADAALSAKATMTQSRASVVASRVSPAAEEEEVAVPAVQETEAAMIQAVARTFVFGFADDVAIRFAVTAGGTQVDMRSASRTGMHDLGQNARRIRQFFADLDTALQPDPNAPPPPAPSEGVPTAQVAPAG